MAQKIDFASRIREKAKRKGGEAGAAATQQTGVTEPPAAGLELPTDSEGNPSLDPYNTGGGGPSPAGEYDYPPQQKLDPVTKARGAVVRGTPFGTTVESGIANIYERVTDKPYVRSTDSRMEPETFWGEFGVGALEIGTEALATWPIGAGAGKLLSQTAEKLWGAGKAAAKIARGIAGTATPSRIERYTTAASDMLWGGVDTMADSFDATFLQHKTRAGAAKKLASLGAAEAGTGAAGGVARTLGGQVSHGNETIEYLSEMTGSMAPALVGYTLFRAGKYLRAMFPDRRAAETALADMALLVDPNTGGYNVSLTPDEIQLIGNELNMDFSASTIRNSSSIRELEKNLLQHDPEMFRTYQRQLQHNARQLVDRIEKIGPGNVRRNLFGTSERRTAHQNIARKLDKQINTTNKNLDAISRGYQSRTDAIDTFNRRVTVHFEEAKAEAYKMYDVLDQTVRAPNDEIRQLHARYAVMDPEHRTVLPKELTPDVRAKMNRILKSPSNIVDPVTGKKVGASTVTLKELKDLRSLAVARRREIYRQGAEGHANELAFLNDVVRTIHDPMNETGMIATHFAQGEAFEAASANYAKYIATWKEGITAGFFKGKRTIYDAPSEDRLKVFIRPNTDKDAVGASEQFFKMFGGDDDVLQAGKSYIADKVMAGNTPEAMSKTFAKYEHAIDGLGGRYRDELEAYINLTKEGKDIEAARVKFNLLFGDDPQMAFTNIDKLKNQPGKYRDAMKTMRARLGDDKELNQAAREGVWNYLYTTEPLKRVAGGPENAVALLTHKPESFLRLIHDPRAQPLLEMAYGSPAGWERYKKKLTRVAEVWNREAKRMDTLQAARPQDALSNNPAGNVAELLFPAIQVTAMRQAKTTNPSMVHMYRIPVYRYAAVQVHKLFESVGTDIALDTMRNYLIKNPDSINDLLRPATIDNTAKAIKRLRGNLLTPSDDQIDEKEQPRTVGE